MLTFKRKRRNDYLCIGLFPFELFTSSDGSLDNIKWALDAKNHAYLISKAEERAFKRIYGNAKTIADKCTIPESEVSRYCELHKCSSTNRAMLALLPKDDKKKTLKEIARGLKYHIEEIKPVEGYYEVTYSAKFISI